MTFGAYAQEARPPKSGPIEITVGTAAGGTPDVVMRTAAKVLNDTGLVSQPLVVQNRTGGSWAVAANFVMERRGNENLILGLAGPLWATPIAQGVPTIYDKVTPIAMFVRGEVVVGVHPNSGINNLKDLIAKAGERERGMKVAGAQVGAVDHVVTGLLEKTSNVKFNYIPFDGGGAAQTAFLGNNSDMIVLGLVEGLTLAKDGKVKLIALLSDQRRTDEQSKDIPTALEQGFDVTWDQTWGFAGPPGLDPSVVKWWNEKIEAMKKTPQWKAAVEANGWRTVDVPTSEVGEWVANYHSKYRTALQNIGLAKN
jgi:putative tricarboxylic transport membrane protein